MLTATGSVSLLGLAGMAQGQDGSTIASAPVVASATYPTLGTDSSNPTLDVYGNAKCPYTREFVFSNLQMIIEEFVDTGRLNVRFRNLAYNIGGGGSGYLTSADPTIAEGGLAIWNEDPQNWPQYFHDLFENQPSGSVSPSDLESRAQSAGISADSPGSSDQYNGPVRQTAQRAGSVGVSYTPTLVLDGETKPGRNSEGNIRRWIEANIDSAPSNTNEQTEDSSDGSSQEDSTDESSQEEEADEAPEEDESEGSDEVQETDEASQQEGTSDDSDDEEDEAPSCPFSG